MFLKRILHSLRTWKVIIAQLLVPCLFTAITLVVVKTLPKPQDSPALTLSTVPFKSNIIPYYIPQISTFSEKQTLWEVHSPFPTEYAVEEFARLYAEQFNGTLSHAVNIFTLPEYRDATLDDYIIQESDHDIGKFLSKCIIAAVFGQKVNSSILTAYFNNQPYHGPGISLSAIDNAILK